MWFCFEAGTRDRGPGTRKGEAGFVAGAALQGAKPLLLISSGPRSPVPGPGSP